MHRPVGEFVEVITLSLWDDLDAVKAFAGADPEVARFYPGDDDLLVREGRARRPLDRALLRLLGPLPAHDAVLGALPDGAARLEQVEVAEHLGEHEVGLRHAARGATARARPRRRCAARASARRIFSARRSVIAARFSHQRGGARERRAVAGQDQLAAVLDRRRARSESR